MATARRWRDEAAQWATRLPALPWPLRHQAFLDAGLGNAAEALAREPSLAMAARRAHAEESVAAFDRALTAVQRLREERRLTVRDRPLPMFLAADVDRVRDLQATLRDSGGDPGR